MMQHTTRIRTRFTLVCAFQLHLLGLRHVYSRGVWCIYLCDLSVRLSLVESRSEHSRSHPHPKGTNTCIWKES